MPSFTATRRVEFRDTDAAGIMHFAAFFPMMESVECEFLRHIGHSVIDRDADGEFSWPRVNVQCEYRSAAQFEDELTVTLSVARLGEKSVTYKFDIRNDDQLVAEGQMTAVCCRLPTSDSGLQSMPIPADIAEKLKPFAS